MELTRAHRILLDAINSKDRTWQIAESNFLSQAENSESMMHYVLKAMDIYAREKWEEACNETWQAVNEAMGDQPVEDALNLVNVIHPEFKP